MIDVLGNPRVQLGVNLGTLATVIFGGGVMWQKVEGLSQQVQQLEVRSQMVTPAAGERLARVETKVEMLNDRLANNEKKLDSIDDKLDRLLRR